MKITKILFCVCIIFLVFCRPSFSQTVWQDDFDGFTSGWTPSSANNSWHFFPWTSDPATYPPGSRGLGITNYEPSTVSPGSRTNDNSWNGWYKASGAALSIVTSGGRNNTPCLRIRYDKVGNWIEDTGLIKWLGPTRYQEIYVQYYFKYGNGTDWRWNGSLTNGRPSSPGFLLWKQLRIWTGFNPVDYGKTGGQTLPAENTTISDESNWRYGIWVPRILMPWAGDPWGTAGHPFFNVANFYWPPTCVVGGSSQCDSQHDSYEGNANTTTIDWSTSPSGFITTHLNSGNALNSSGQFTESQTWHRIEYRFKNNSYPGANDGALQIWVDGVALENPTKNNVIAASMSSNPNDYGINFVSFNANNAGLTANIADSPGYQYYFMDDVVISTTPIGPFGDDFIAPPTDFRIVYPQ